MTGGLSGDMGYEPDGPPPPVPLLEQVAPRYIVGASFRVMMDAPFERVLMHR